MFTSVKTKLARWLMQSVESEVKAEVKALVEQQFSDGQDILRHKIPHREPKQFDLEHRQ